MILNGTYGGLVEGNKDPLKMGRLKVRVPHFYGAVGGGSGFVSTNDIPWAMPAGMPAGGSGNAGGFSHLPEVGDKVWVRFLDGEPEKPIWEWGMQSYDDTNALHLHSYKTGLDGSVGAPDRAVWTRYNHAFELNAGGIIASTSGGYRILLNDSTTPASHDGSIMISTPLGNSLSLDDLTSTLTLVSLNDVDFQIDNSLLGLSYSYKWVTTAGDYSVDAGGLISLTSALNVEINAADSLFLDAINSVELSAGTTLGLLATTSLSMTAPIVDITADTSLQISSPFIYVGIGAIEPMVLGQTLISFINSLLLYISTHTHTSGEAGSPTSPPMVPPQATLSPLVPLLVSRGVFVK
jgi:hypothetical protein